MQFNTKYILIQQCDIDLTCMILQNNDLKMILTGIQNQYKFTSIIHNVDIIVYLIRKLSNLSL